MPNIESFIEGSQKLTDIFGYWPSFHDAEVIEMHLWRGETSADETRAVFPVLAVKLHVWEMTSEVDASGFYVSRHHTLTTLRFHGVAQVRMEGFNEQNAIFVLSIVNEEPKDDSSALFSVDFSASFGMSASFACFRIEVVDAVRCTKEGKVYA